LFEKYLSIILVPIAETLYMTLFSVVISFCFGFPIGYLIFEKKRNIKNISKFSKIILITIENFVNIFRSFPFIILMIILFPLSRMIVGTTIGTTASIVPLTVAAIPFVARITENALSNVDKNIIKMAEMMGGRKKDILLKILIPESLPSIINGLTLTSINLIGFTAMAGAVGGGGLGDLAVRYGFHRFKTDILMISVLAIIIIVQLIQSVGNRIERSILAKR